MSSESHPSLPRAATRTPTRVRAAGPPSGSRLSVDSLLEPPFELRTEGATGDEGADGGEPKREDLGEAARRVARRARARAVRWGADPNDQRSSALSLSSASGCCRKGLVSKGSRVPPSRVAVDERTSVAARRCQRTHLCRGKLSPSQRARWEGWGWCKKIVLSFGFVPAHARALRVSCSLSVYKHVARHRCHRGSAARHGRRRDTRWRDDAGDVILQVPREDASR